MPSQNPLPEPNADDGRAAAIIAEAGRDIGLIGSAA